MLVFVDESGDAGFKFEQNSSRYFVVAMIAFANDERATAVAIALADFQKSLGQRDEFKFSKMNNSRRLNLAQFISTLDFEARVFTIDKTSLELSFFSQNGIDAYQWMIAQALLVFQNDFSKARFRLDGTHNRQFKRLFKSYIRQTLAVEIADLTFVDSTRTELLQLADFIAGVVHRQKRGEDSEKLLEILRSKITLKELKKEPLS